MRIPTTRSLVCAMALAAMARTASSQTNSAGGSVAPGAMHGYTLDARELQVLKGMSDADILGHLITVDSIEVVAADSALRLSKSDDVLDLAKQMKALHNGAFKQEKDLAKEQGITPTTIFGGFKATHVAASLDSVGIASDLTIDRHYVMSQVELHQHLLAELDALQGNTKNAALRQQIVSMMPALRDGLSRAETLASKKGFQHKHG
jgi:predicted outer membrane protein